MYMLDEHCTMYIQCIMCKLYIMQCKLYVVGILDVSFTGYNVIIGHLLYNMFAVCIYRTLAYCLYNTVLYKNSTINIIFFMFLLHIKAGTYHYILNT